MALDHAMIRRAYIDVGSDGRAQQLHYRYGGQGDDQEIGQGAGKRPALMLLHASPMSSAALLPFIHAVTDYAYIIAPDTPGYGQSDPLPEAESAAGLRPYVDSLERFRRRLDQKIGLASFGLYGTATGAQIAIEYAKRHPQRVDYLILDNVAHFTDAEHDAISGGYFPDLRPDPLGAHLVKTWTMCRDQGLYFPWHQQDEDSRLASSAVSLEFVQMMAMHYLRAGAEYDRAYRAAFANEKRERLLDLAAPTTILRWPGSILKKYTDRFDAIALPEHIRMRHCGATRQARVAGFAAEVKAYAGRPAAAALADNLASNLASSLTDNGAHNGADKAPEDVADNSTRNVPHESLHDVLHHVSSKEPTQGGRAYFDLGVQALHYRYQPAAGAGVSLLLHPPGESSRAVAEYFGQHRNGLLLAPDLPGHGYSSDFDVSRDNALADLSQPLAQLIKALDPPTVRLCAWGEAAAIAITLTITLARELPGVVSAVKLINPLDYTQLHAECDEDEELFSAAAEPAGGHLLKTWYMLRDRQLFWPWYKKTPAHALAGCVRLDAEYLTARLLDYIQAGAMVNVARRAVLRYRLCEQINALATGTATGTAIDTDIQMTAGYPLRTVCERSLAGLHKP